MTDAQSRSPSPSPWRIAFDELSHDEAKTLVALVRSVAKMTAGVGDEGPVTGGQERSDEDTAAVQELELEANTGAPVGANSDTDAEPAAAEDPELEIDKLLQAIDKYAVPRSL